MSLAPFNQGAINAVITIFVTFPTYKELICCKRLNKSWLDQMKRPTTWAHITASPVQDFDYYSFRLAQRKVDFLEKETYRSSPFITQLEFDVNSKTNFAANNTVRNYPIDVSIFIYLRKLTLHKIKVNNELQIIGINRLPKLEYLTFRQCELQNNVSPYKANSYKVSSIKNIEFDRVTFTVPSIFAFIFHLSNVIEEFYFRSSGTPDDLCFTIKHMLTCRKLVIDNPGKNDEVLRNMILGTKLQHLELTFYYNNNISWTLLGSKSTPNLTYLNISKTNIFYIDDSRLQSFFDELENLEILVNVYDLAHNFGHQVWSYTCDMFGDPVRLIKRKKPLLYFTNNLIKACKTIASAMLFEACFDKTVHDIAEEGLEAFTDHEKMRELNCKCEKVISPEVREVVFGRDSSFFLYRWGNNHDEDMIKRMKFDVKCKYDTRLVNMQFLYNYIGCLINTVARKLPNDPVLLRSGYDDDNNENCTCEYIH